jgi:hypothetical protein
VDPGPIEDDNCFDNGDPENCGTGTVCYDLVPSQLVLSDHSISAFQQGHQAFPLVNSLATRMELCSQTVILLNKLGISSHFGEIKLHS